MTVADAFAALICDWCLEVVPGHQVLVETDHARPGGSRRDARSAARPWRLAAAAGSADELEAEFYRHARDRQLDEFAPFALTESEAVDSRVLVRAPANTNALAGIDPALPPRVARARLPLQRARSARRWCLSMWPTPALAQQARMADRDYAEFLRGALFLDQPDPIGAWRSLSERQDAIVSRLATAREVRIEADRHRPASQRRRAEVGQLRRSPQHAERRGLHKPAGALGERPDPVRRSLDQSGLGRRRRRVDVQGRRGRGGASGPRRRAAAGSARHGRGRAVSRRAWDRDQLGDRSRHRLDTARREDRRHGSPRARSLVSRRAGGEPVGAALGPDLRPARRRTARADGERSSTTVRS